MSDPKGGGQDRGEDKHLTQRRTTEKKKSYKIKNLHLTRPVPWYPGWADMKRGRMHGKRGKGPKWELAFGELRFAPGIGKWGLGIRK